MIDKMFAFDELLPIDLRSLEGPFEADLVCVTHAHTNLFHASLDEQVGYHLVVVAFSDGIARASPFVLWTERLANSIQPRFK